MVVFATADLFLVETVVEDVVLVAAWRSEVGVCQAATASGGRLHILDYNQNANYSQSCFLSKMSKSKQGILDQKLTALTFSQLMNSKESSQKVGAVFFDRNHIGLAFYCSSSLRLQCSCIYHLCTVSYHILLPFLHNCTVILTNSPSHDLFTSINLERTAMFEVNEKSLEYDIIEHNLMRISNHVKTLNNPKAYFKKMAENVLKFNALGMVLFHLLNQPETERPKIFLEDIEFFTDTLFQSVSYSKSELHFLELTKEDIHPSLIKGKGASKEGYSVLSAYESYLVSTGSKRILRYLFLNPTYNRTILQERYGNVEWMKQYMRETNKYMKYFRNVHVLESIVKKFGRMYAEEEDWKKLVKTLEAMLELRKLISFGTLPRVVADYVNDPAWDELLQMFNIFKSTLDFSPLSIRSGIDQTLDQLKQTYDNMPHILTLIAKEQQWNLQYFRIIFMTQVGYLIKLEKDMDLPDDFQSEDWVLQFSNNSGKYYSNSLTQTLDREYGDIFGEIQDIQKKIIFDMQALIIERQAIILKLYWKLCQIECYWGISQLSKNMCRPKISSEALIISNGWHILLTGSIIHNNSFSFPQSQAPSHRVYNSQKNLVNLNYSNRCMIITGPNASGKTVFMKQLGIIVYLAHVGVFVPASLAEIPLVDSILCVGRSESIYNEQMCGFQSELDSLSAITQPNVLSNKSLVLIDELGAEIDYENSLKILYASLEYLTSKTGNFQQNRLLTKPSDEFCTPLVIVVTHLSEILSNSIVEENYMMRFLTMAVEEEGMRLFKIKPGLVAKGYGIRAASEIMPAGFIELSRKYLTLMAQL